MILGFEYITILLIVVVYVFLMIFFTYLGRLKYKEYMKELNDDKIFK